VAAAQETAWLRGDPGSRAHRAFPRNRAIAAADERFMRESTVKIVREGKTFFWEVLCPACGTLVFENVLHVACPCEACGTLVVVDLLRMKTRDQNR
jgi:ribosomal protein S27E